MEVNISTDFLKEQAQNIFKKGKSSAEKLYNKYEGWCEKSGKKVGGAISRLSGHSISPQLAEKVAIGALKVLPIALTFLALTPMLSLTSLVLVGAVSTVAVLLDPKILPPKGKVKVLEGAALGIALQTTLTVLRSLVTLSPITAIGALVVGGAATAIALYASKAIKV